MNLYLGMLMAWTCAKPHLYQVKQISLLKIFSELVITQGLAPC